MKSEALLMLKKRNCMEKAVALGHTKAMASGQVVLVTTEGLSGGPPMRTVYYVAEENPAKAEAIIAKFMAPNEKVEAFGLLPEAAVKALRLKPGEFIHA
jgi:hypothetical protein